jgi:hypothetical protein
MLTLMLILAAGAAQADTMTWVDIDAYGTKLSAGQWMGGALDIVGPESDSIVIGSGYPDAGDLWEDATGFVVGTPVTEARITFWVSDDAYDGGLARREYAYVDLLGDGEWGTIREVDLDLVELGASARLLSYLSYTGQVVWAVGSLKGDFVLDYVALEASAGADAHMPEPSAVALFGVGTLLVAGAIRRRS